MCPSLLYTEFAIFVFIPVIAYLFLRGRFAQTSLSKLSPSTVWGFQAGALMIAMLVVGWHITIRQFGCGDAPEIIALFVLQSVGWYLAVFSRVPGFERASLVLCGAIVFFVCCMADKIEVFVTSSLFAVATLWWLLGQYWSRLETKSIDGNARLLPVQGAAVGITTLVIAVVIFVAALLPITQYGIGMNGFTPFSGGEKGRQSDFAISGIGDGRMLTAGNNASTTGAVDSNEFIEDDKPSLYDVLSEQYEGPARKRTRTRAISLDVQAKHLHDVKQSEQAGRTFRTMRNSDDTNTLELESKITKALFFVEGSVPARFANNSFHHFDGWDWTTPTNNVSLPQNPSIVIEKQSSRSIFRLARAASDYLTTTRSHCVKIMRLQTSTLPAPALLERWHIPQVDNLDLFRFNEAGLVRMDGDAIATHTIIDLQSFVPNFHMMRSRKYRQPAAGSKGDRESKESRFLQLPENNTTSKIRKLSAEYTAGIAPGWKQVEAIVNQLRADFDLKPNWEVDEQTDDTVGRFFDQHGGPSYMFATTCALALRTAGYPTRLTSGFLVQDSDYDSWAGQSNVTSSNLHMWPEVCLDGRFWTPVEPTPGFPMPYSTQTLWQFVSAKASMLWNFIWKNPMTSVFLFSCSAAVFVFRAELITSLMFAWWFLISTLWPKRLLRTTRQLIDLRFRFAGDQRPACETIRSWYRRVAPNESPDFCDLWNAQNFSSVPPTISKTELVAVCRDSLDLLTLKKIREYQTDVTKVDAI